MNAQDVLHAWRDFECSFFAGALLAPEDAVPALPGARALPGRGGRASSS